MAPDEGVHPETARFRCKLGLGADDMTSRNLLDGVARLPGGCLGQAAKVTGELSRCERPEHLHWARLRGRLSATRSAGGQRCGAHNEEQG